MKNKTHTGMVYRCMDYRCLFTEGRLVQLHKTKMYWIDSDGSRYSKRDGYANSKWMLDLDSVMPIGCENEND